MWVLTTSNMAMRMPSACLLPNASLEKVGTGTEDIVKWCKGKGLQDPEYHQDEDFRVVLWRKSVPGNDKGLEAGNVAGNVKRIVLGIGEGTLPREEIMLRLGLKGSGNFRATYLYPAIEQGYVAKLYPESDKRRDQAYYLTEKGLELLLRLSQTEQ